MTSLSVMCYRYDCGILALKYMEFWNRATLTNSLAEVRVGLHHNLYLFSSILSNNFELVVLICVGQDAHVQIAASCDITTQ